MDASLMNTARMSGPQFSQPILFDSGGVEGGAPSAARASGADAEPSDSDADLERVPEAVSADDFFREDEEAARFLGLDD